MADRSMHCAMLNNPSFRASVAGDKSRDLQANGGGVGCAVTGLGERAEWGGQNRKYPKGITRLVLYRLVQLNSIKTKPKKTFYLHSTFQAVSFEHIVIK